MVYVFLADGFEEIEALCPVDLLRRAGVDVKTVGVTGKIVTGSHAVSLEADILPADVADDAEMLVFPGGLAGTAHLDESPEVDRWVRRGAEQGIYLCAICAAPTILGKRGLLRGRKATCFPGCEQALTGAEYLDDDVVVDGKYITGHAMGASVEFGLALVSALCGADAASALRAKIYYQTQGGAEPQ